MIMPGKLFLLLCALAFNTAQAENEYPKIKAGLWESTTSAGASAAQSSKMCVGDNFQDQVLKILSNMGGMMKCSKQEMRKQGADYLGITECNSMGMQISSTSTFSGDFNSNYRGVIDTKVVGGPMAIPPTRSRHSSRFIGPCPEGMKAGDMLLPNGQQVNIQKIGEQLKNMDINSLREEALKFQR